MTDPDFGDGGSDGDGGDRTKTVLVVILIILACAVTGLVVYILVGGDGDVADTTTTTTTTTSATSVAPSTSREGSQSRDDSGPADDGGGSGAGGSISPCTPAALLDAAGGSIGDIPVRVVDVACTEAAGGYAWALMEPTDPAVVADPVSVYFRNVGGTWDPLDYGTGIDCGDAGIPAEACASLP